jgi:hypothetical protein
MKGSALGFPPLTAWQRSLLDDIKGLKKALADFDGLPPERQPDELVPTEIEIDNLTAKAARSGLVKPYPSSKDSKDWILHPDLPSWAERHFRNWILNRRAWGHRSPLRQARIGLETGVKEPLPLELKEEVLRLRNVREEDGIPKLDTEESPHEKNKKVRKERASWERVIQKLVEKKLLDHPISRQALKDKLKNLFPEIKWDKV